MSTEEFERRVAELIRDKGLPESVAREQVSVEAGEGGDVEIDGEKPVDPVDVMDSLGDQWKPRK